jgi:myosin heavy subunit
MNAPHQLTVIERASVALGASECEKQIKALVEQSKGITVITNKDGREECHAAAMKAVKVRTALSKDGAIARADATAYSKAVIAEEKRLLSLIEPEERRLKVLRDEWDAAREAERMEAARIEGERQADLQAKIDAIRNYPLRASSMAAIFIKELHDDLLMLPITDPVYQERAGEAAFLRDESLKQLSVLLEGKLAQEQLAAQQEAQRLEQARFAAEQEAEHKAAQEREHAAIKAEAERQKLEREELARQKAEILEAQRKEEERLTAQRAELEAMQRKIDEAKAEAQRKVDQEAAEREHQRRLAEEEAQRIANELELQRLTLENPPESTPIQPVRRKWSNLLVTPIQVGIEAVKTPTFIWPSLPNMATSDELLEIYENDMQAIAKVMHYPDCWDQAAYSTLLDAISEVFKCSNCN